ncbi:MAG: stage II sporulation protein M [Candidatus Dormibacteria bacterium]
MNLETFNATRRARWAELEHAVTQAGGLRSLTAAHIEALVLLYRRAVSDLALARRDFPDSTVTEYLNDLCGRTHVVLHRGAPPRVGTVIEYFRRGVPRVFRANTGYFLVAFGALLLGAVCGWLAFAFRPDLRAILVPHSAFDDMAKGNTAAGLPSPGLLAPTLFLHNIQVALVVFIAGVALGIPTVVLVFENGWILGTLGASVHAGGYDVAFWSLIAAHGILELSIIVCAGAAGLRLGDAVMRPRGRTRPQAIAEAAREIVGMMMGIILLLVVAGITEAFVSPSALPQAVKVVWGLALGSAFYAWLLVAGRRSATRRPTPQLDRQGGATPLRMRRLPTTGD